MEIILIMRIKIFMILQLISIKKIKIKTLTKIKLIIIFSKFNN
jgi:hypothetical protein